MTEQSGGSNKVAQTEKDHQKFLKEFEGRLKEANFTKDQVKELINEAKTIKTGDNIALGNLVKKYGTVLEANNKATDEQHNNEKASENAKTSDPDFEEFVTFAQAVGLLRSDTKINKLTEDEIKELTPKFKQWIKKGKPTAVDPLEDDEPERILRVSRRREFGKQFLTYIVSGEDKPRGIELIPTYRKYKLNNQLVEDKATVVSTKPRYTITYSKPKAEELMKRCIEESETPSFTFKQGGRTTTIRDPNNFIGDFDEVMKKAVKGDPV